MPKKAESEPLEFNYPFAVYNEKTDWIYIITKSGGIKFNSSRFFILRINYCLLN